ncbi:MAG: DUF2878 domain-containing protein [Deltaproteobacteria bacterium]|nr:DUF2878 domain-containing protein [Deltaproteobacteria bacterium]
MTPLIVSRRWSLVDFVAHQAVWWACVLVARTDAAAWAPLAIVPYVLLHALADRRLWPTLATAGGAATVGFTVDAMLIALGAARFAGAAGILPPPWMGSLWAALALSCRASLRWLQRRPTWTVMIIGAIAGPLAYWGGERLEVIALTRSFSPLAVAGLWSLALPTVVLIARKIDGRRQRLAVGRLNRRAEVSSC